MQEKKDGKVRLLLNVHVDKDGNDQFINVVETSGFKILDKISVRNIKNWKFIPAKLGNKFVDDNLNIPVKFVLIRYIIKIKFWRPLRDSNPCCRRERAVS